MEPSDSGNTPGIGRPSKTEPFRKFVRKLLDEDATLPGRELLRRARTEGYRGGKSAFYEFIRDLRPPDSTFTYQFDAIAGEFSQHDFGVVNVTYIDGTREKLTFFASRLKYSRVSRVTIVPDQTAETLVRSTCDHFAFFGGVPLLAVFDRPRTAALKWKKDGTITEYNPVFEHAMFEMGVGAEVCWPYSPQQKGSVEQLVKYVKNSFFKVRQFADLDDLLAQLQQWHVEVNEQTPSRAKGEIPAIRMKVEALRLRPLKVTPQELAVRVPIRIGPTGMVALEGNHYSMSPDSCGYSGTAHLFTDRIKFTAGKFSCEHNRFPKGAGRKSILAEHRNERLGAVNGKRGKHYLMRQHLFDLGEIGRQFIEACFIDRPRAWYDEVRQLHELLDEYGESAMRLAMHMAKAEDDFTSAAVRRLISDSARPEQYQ
jgi:transposase